MLIVLMTFAGIPATTTLSPTSFTTTEFAPTITLLPIEQPSILAPVDI